MPLVGRGTEPLAGVGVVVPFDFAQDRELWRWIPDHAQLHLTRTPFVPSPMTEGMARAISEEAPILQATRDVLLPEPGVVAYACASGSFVDGTEGEARIRATMARAGAPRTVTTSGGLVDALASLGVRRVALVTPYIDALNGLLLDYLRAHDVVTTAVSGLGLLGQIWRVSIEELVESVRLVDTPDADAVFISCTNLATYDLIRPLERELGKPVLTANQVTMWAALRALSLQANGPGQRLIDRGSVSAAAVDRPAQPGQPERPVKPRPAPPRRRPAAGTLASDHQPATAPTSLHKIRVQLTDESGALARLSETIADAGGNILSLAVHWQDSSSVVDELYVVTHPTVSSADLAHAVATITEERAYAMSADPHELADAPTRALELAVQARDHPEALAQALLALVHADEVHETEEPPQPDEHQLVLVAPGDQAWLVLTRQWAPFTLTERTRAEAFLRTVSMEAALASP
jgi:maleate cis-trans isomerase